MGKLKREAHMFYIKAPKATNYYLVGKDIDDMSVEMNGSYEQKQDITGQSSVSDSGYQPQVGVDPYYANPDDEIYEFLKDLALNRKSGDDSKAQYLEVLVEDPVASSHEAWQEDCKIEIVSYGGDTSGLQIVYNVWPDGNRQEGTVTMNDKVPTFTAKNSVSSVSNE